MTPDDLEQIRAIVVAAVAEAFASHAPPPVRKSRAGYLTLIEAGELVRTAPETIRHWIWEGRLTGYKPGAHVLVKEADLLALVEASEATNKRAARRKATAKK